MFSLKNKTVVITGGTSGLGKAAVYRFSKAGAKVVMAGRQDIGKDIAKDANALFIKTDVSKEEQVKVLMNTAMEEYGKLDVLINNAGIGHGADITEITEEDFDRIQNVNTKGVIWGIKHAVPLMTEGGSIINTSSAAGLFAFPSYGSYSASKFAIIGLTKTAALELAPKKIRVNCVCPGTFDTADPGTDTEMAVANYIHPLRRIGQPEEVAAAYHFLASDDASFITGTAIPVDGGLSAGIGLGIVESLIKLTDLEGKK
jgi:3alpha(or 20beta)-hydroxysteroid dehydrogenase